MKLSIIVPIYNVGEYLPRCLDSILEQNFSEEMEVLLINDGSTDNSELICQEYLAKDPRLKYYYKTNGGLSSARNYGIAKSTGDYLYFVDSDDYLEANTCQILYSKALAYDADLVVGGYRTIDAKTDEKLVYSPTMGQEFFQLDSLQAREEFVDKLLREKIIIEVIWNKLYKRSLFDNLQFPYRKFEDTFMCCDLYNAAKRIVFVEQVVYNYILNRAGSITSMTEVDVERWDSLFMKVYNFWLAFPELKITNLSLYTFIKYSLRGELPLKNNNYVEGSLCKMIKALPLNKVGLKNKLKALIRYK